MNTTLILVAIISVMANVIQIFVNKKSSDIKNLQNRIDLMDKVQEQQTKVYESESNRRNNEITSLRNKTESQDILISNLQLIVAKLIGAGCHVDNCAKRDPYTIEEISKITKTKNHEENNTKHKK